MSEPRIAIVGSGANGASIGADLTAAGLDVTLVEQWPEHVATMRERGIRIEMPERTLEIEVDARHLCEVATFREQFDIVLLLMKAYDARWSSQLIEPYLKPDGLLAGVQNGMTTDVIADVVGPRRTVGCVIEISSMMTEPGIVRRDSGPDRSYFAVGGIDPAVEGREHEIADLLSHSAAVVDIVDDIRAAKWMKLISNSTTLATSAILGLPIIEAAKLEEMRALMVRSGEEAVRAGHAQSFPVLPIFGLEAKQMRRDDLVPFLLETLLQGFVLPETTTTILHDWLKGRRSEVTDINGAVVAALARVGEPAPVNSAIVEIGRRIECGELAPDPSNLSLLVDLTGASAGRPGTGSDEAAPSGESPDATPKGDLVNG